MFVWLYDWMDRRKQKKNEPKVTFYTPMDIPPPKRRKTSKSTVNFIYNGKRIYPGDPEWDKANAELEKGMATLDREMKKMDETFKRIFK